MKILLFGITNVGKTTIGKMLSHGLKYDYDDLDDEIKRRYKSIINFQKEYPYDYDRHKIRGEILLDIINKYEDNVVIAVSPIFYEEFFIKAIKQPNVLAIELQDTPECILDRLQYSDENDNVFPLIMNTKAEKNYYLKEIKADIRYYKKAYEKIENKFDMQGETKEDVVKRLLKYIKNK